MSETRLLAGCHPFLSLTAAFHFRRSGFLTSVKLRRPAFYNDHMDEEDGVDEYLDPEYDDNLVRSSGDSNPIPGPLSLSQLVTGMHVLTAVLILPFLLLAARNGNIPQVASLTVLIVLILIAGVYAGRITKRREP